MKKSTLKVKKSGRNYSHQEAKERLQSIYRRLYSYFGPQRWWPGDSPFEVMIGAILTQNTNWLNVEKAINNLKKNKLLNFAKLKKLSIKKLALHIKPAGYYNIKAKRLRNFFEFLHKDDQGNFERVSSVKTGQLRQELLSVNGVGPETADSILLYALNRPVFVVDAYTKRIFSRQGLIEENATYEDVQNLFMQNLKNEVKLFNEYHALLVKLGKDFCLKNNPRCIICPLQDCKRRTDAKNIP